ncbi:MAG: lambda-exonuclease family protein [Pseudobdellovibrio sp.]
MAISELNEDELKSNAVEYSKWRSKRIGSSDIPVILGESPFKTPFQLWKEKTGRSENSFYTNHAIELGKRFENTVRMRLEFQLDIDFTPTIIYDDKYEFMMSSLDGYNEEHNLVLEIKSVQGGPTWEKACAGVVSSSYISQVQHQLYVSKAKKNLFNVAKLAQTNGVYRIEDTRLIEVFHDKDKQDEIIKASLEFYNFMTNDIAPPLHKRDCLFVNDDEAVSLLKDKLKLIEYMVKKYNHTNFDISGNRLLKDKNDLWRLTLNKG